MTPDETADLVEGDTEVRSALLNLHRAQLTPFFERNPLSSLEDVDGEIVVRRPWGDPTIELPLPDSPESFIADLNRLYLPPMFSAVWHVDTNDFEVIWTTVTPTHDLRARKFSFRFQDDTLACEFADASPSLLSLSANSRSGGPPTRTSYRNLPGLYLSIHYREEHPEMPQANQVPTSFWIRGLSNCDEQKILTLVRHLNFFMSYYDRRTPRILVHEEPPEAQPAASIRFPAGPFPETITGRLLDPFLLGLWSSALDAADPYRRFIYAFQVLEYTAFYYRREATTLAISKILSAPDIATRQKELAHEILDVIANDNMSDDQKLTALLRNLVDPEVIWADIEPHKDYFSREITFEGGFKLNPLIREEWGVADFKTAFDPILADNVRRIRNALVHSRDTRQSLVIWPTIKNYELLRPWLAPLLSAAMQVILFADLVV